MGRVLAGLTALSHALATAFGGAPSIAATVGLSGTALGVLLVPTAGGGKPRARCPSLSAAPSV